MNRKDEEDELMIIKSGDEKTAFDVEEKLRKSFGKIIKFMLEAEMDEWKSRSLEKVYPFVYIDAIHFNVKTISVLNDIKNRGVKDILVLSYDGVTGIQESIKIAYPKAEHQTCMVHFVRNTLKYVNHKDKAQFVQDLKAIYTASNEEIGKKIMLEMCKTNGKQNIQ